MAGKNREIDIVLRAKDEATKTLIAFSGTLGDLVQNFAKIGAAGGIVVGAFEGLQKAGEAVKDFIKESIDSALASQDAYNRLGSAVELAGQKYSDLRPELEETLRGIQKTTRFSDEDAAEALQRLITFTGDYDSALKALPVALDLAARLHIDLSSATKVVGVAIEGNVTALARYGIRLDDSTKKAIEFADQETRTSLVLDALSKKVGGSAVVDAQTLSGEMAKLKNQFDEVKEAVGNFILAAVDPGSLREFTVALGELAQTITDVKRAVPPEAFKIIVQVSGLAEAQTIITLLRLLGNEVDQTAQDVAAAEKKFEGGFDGIRRAVLTGLAPPQTNDLKDFIEHIEFEVDEGAKKIAASLSRLKATGVKLPSDELKLFNDRLLALQAAKPWIPIGVFNDETRKAKEAIEKLEGTDPGRFFDQLSHDADRAAKSVRDSIAGALAVAFPAEEVPKIAEALSALGPEVRKSLQAAFSDATFKETIGKIDFAAQINEGLKPGDATAALIKQYGTLGTEARADFIDRLSHGEPFALPQPEAALPEILLPSKSNLLGSTEFLDVLGSIPGDVADVSSAFEDLSGKLGVTGEKLYRLRGYTDDDSKAMASLHDALVEAFAQGGDPTAALVAALQSAKAAGIDVLDVIKDFPEAWRLAIDGANALSDVLKRLKSLSPAVDPLQKQLEEIGNASLGSIPNVDALTEAIRVLKEQQIETADVAEKDFIQSQIDIAESLVATGASLKLAAESAAIWRDALVAAGVAAGQAVATHQSAAQAIKNVVLEAIASQLLALAKEQIVLALAALADYNYGGAVLHFAAAAAAGAGAGYVRGLETKAAKGGIVAGSESGDKHPFLLESGEAIASKSTAAQIFGGRAALISPKALGAAFSPAAPALARTIRDVGATLRASSATIAGAANSFASLGGGARPGPLTDIAAGRAITQQAALTVRSNLASRAASRTAPAIVGAGSTDNSRRTVNAQFVFNEPSEPPDPEDMLDAINDLVKRRGYELIATRLRREPR
jgi:hypothetical protein